MVAPLKRNSDSKKRVSKPEKGNKKPSLKKYFGALKRGLDGLTYQKEARRGN